MTGPGQEGSGDGEVEDTPGTESVEGGFPGPQQRQFLDNEPA